MGIISSTRYRLKHIFLLPICRLMYKQSNSLTKRYLDKRSGRGDKQPPCDFMQPLRADPIVEPCENIANCNTGDARMSYVRSRPFKPDPFHRKPSHIYKLQQQRTNAAAYTTMTTMTTIRRRTHVNFVFLIMLLLLVD